MLNIVDQLDVTRNEVINGVLLIPFVGSNDLYYCYVSDSKRHYIAKVDEDYNIQDATVIQLDSKEKEHIDRMIRY